MAETNSTAKTTKKDKEEIFIPRGTANGDPNLFVSVNGVNYVLPRGATSTVPTYVAEEIRRSWRAEERLVKRSEELIEKAKEPLYKI
jgi:hypothetical protein